MTTTATAAVATAVTNPASLKPLTYEETKVGMPVILLQAEESGAIRGKITGRKDGWLSVRFDDGVTRMARAKTLAKDTSTVIAFKQVEPAAAETAPTEQAERVRESVRRVAKATGGKVIAPGSPAAKAAKRKEEKLRDPKRIAKALTVPKAQRPKAEPKPGSLCLCACGQLAKPGRSFLQGHDARFHGWMKRLADQRLKPSEVPAAALALMNLDKDGIPTTDYDGTPWKG